MFRQHRTRMLSHTKCLNEWNSEFGVFALGLILFELLSGEAPLSMDIAGDAHWMSRKKHLPEFDECFPQIISF